MADDKTASVQIKLREGEYELLLRFRQIRNQAGEGRIRLELELTREQIQIINQTLVRPEAFSLTN